MAEQGDEELQRYFKDISFKLKRQLVTVIKQQADELAAAIKAAAPVKTGKLRDSVKVRRGRNTLELMVTAGGEDTTTEFQRNAAYQREVKVGAGEKTSGVARAESGPGITYDYSLAIEFGTSRQSAQPFFWRTYRAKRPDIEQAINDAVEQALKG